MGKDFELGSCACLSPHETFTWNSGVDVNKNMFSFISTELVLGWGIRKSIEKRELESSSTF